MNPEEKLSKEEELRAENDFLKMKLMLERGAQFGTVDSKAELPAEVENEFLKYISEFEKQADSSVRVKIFDKIDRPAHFKPVSQISDENIEEAWKELSEYLERYGISLDVCSPNVTNRELYRFAVEELFEYETCDIKIPGMVQGFIYDEFYPDTAYDNTVMATQTISSIFRARPIEWLVHFRANKISLNQHLELSEEEVKYLINRFKKAYDDIQINKVEDHECMVFEDKCVVKGIYDAVGILSNEQIPLVGEWKIQLFKNEIAGYWDICQLEITGVDF